MVNIKALWWGRKSKAEWMGNGEKGRGGGEAGREKDWPSEKD